MKIKNAAKYVEQSISYKDLTSMFIFELSSDMHYFMDEVRDRLGLAVNAALIPNVSDYNFEPPRPIQAISRFGFKYYVKDTIDLPEAVLNYLCLYSNIHQIPIGTEETQKNIAQIVPEMSDFKRIYTLTHCYAFSKSRYTNKVTSSSSEIPDSYWLTSSINQEELKRLEEQEKQCKEKLKMSAPILNKIMEEKQNIEKKMDTCRNELIKLKERRYHIDNLGKKIQHKQNMLKTLESQSVDLVVEARKIIELISEHSKKKAKIFADHIETSKQLVNLGKEKIMIIYQNANFQQERMKIEGQIRTYLEKKNDLESAIEQMKTRLQNARDDAKIALETASRINEINLEQGIPSNYKREFAKLPETLERLESELHQCEAISQCSYDVDEKIVEDYNNRQKMIEKLKIDLEKKRAKLSSHQNDYESIKNDWISKVEEIIKDISEKFSRLMLQLKCAGEVCLSRPDQADEFAKYGICIKVSFRPDEKLQELTAWQQSGGEKSVSTMLYMIALQEMTKCPFRVVDEINQGMDPVNERKVFDIIVQNSCAKLQAQYFLLTPKLLPDLAFDDKTNVICVFNGPYNLPHSKYNLSQFIENRKKLNEKNI